MTPDLRIIKPSPVTFPAAGKWFKDPDFHTEILRVTDDRDGKRCTHAYSYWPALNFDSTRLLIAIDDVPSLFRFDPESGTLTRHLQLAAPPFQFEGATWSGTNPDLLYALDKRMPRLYRIDVSKIGMPMASVGMVRDFAEDFRGCQLKQMTMSGANGVVCFTVKGNGPDTLAVWDASEDHVYPYPRAEGESVNEGQMNKGGNRVVVHLNDGRTILWAFRLGWKVWLTNPTGHWDCGQSIMVNGDGQQTGIQVRHYSTLDTDRPPRNVFRYFKADGKTPNWTIAEHVSLRAANEDRVLVSTYGGGTAIDNPFEDELILVNTDGSGYTRVCHTFSREGQTNRALRYFSQPRAVLSRDGRFAVWTSDLGSDTRLDVLLARLPG